MKKAIDVLSSALTSMGFEAGPLPGPEGEEAFAIDSQVAEDLDCPAGCPPRLVPHAWHRGEKEYRVLCVCPRCLAVVEL